MTYPCRIRFLTIFLSMVAVSSFAFLPLAQAEEVVLTEIRQGSYEEYALDTEHFTLEFNSVLANGYDGDDDHVADLIEQVAEFAEFSWIREVEELGFPSPLANQDHVLLFLDDQEEYTLPNSYGVTSIFDDGTIYMAINPYFTSDEISVTVAHEFLHVIQFSYMGSFVGYNQDAFFAEQTAVWAEEAAYTDVNDYFNYLPDFFNYPDYSVFTGVVPEGTLFEYASSIWPIFLTEYLNDWTLVPQVVDSYFADEVADVWDAYQAYDRVLEDTYDLDMTSVYQNFALWNYIPSSYKDGAHYPDVYIDATYDDHDYPLSDVSVSEEHLPALFGSSYLQFEINPDSSSDYFNFTLESPTGVPMGVILLPESETEYLVSDAVTDLVPGGGKNTNTVSFKLSDDVVQMTVIVTPLSDDPTSLESVEEAFSVGYRYLYSVSVGDELIAVETETTEPEEPEVKGPEEPEIIPTGEEMTWEEDASLNVFGLEVTSQDAHSVSLQWDRLLDGEFAGYHVYYGTESGDYDLFFPVTVNKPYVTRVTVGDLFPGETYYFVVTAYTEDGKESADFSNEVQATLPLVQFSDVPHSHRNYYAIQFLTYLNVISGYSDLTFRPGQGINRAELVKMLSASDLTEDDLKQYGNCFPDVQDQWYAPYICYAFEQDFVDGYADGLFHPEQQVTKAESLKLILKSLNVEIPQYADLSAVPFDDVVGSAWYAPYVQVAYERGILEDAGENFGANKERTRGAVAENIFRQFVILVMGEEVYSEELLKAFLETWGEAFELGRPNSELMKFLP